MERLTFRHDAPYSEFHQKAELCEPVNCADKYSQTALDALTDRLAAYEDTGLEPEEIPTGLELANVYAAMLLLKQYQGLGTVDEFRALKEAEQKRQEADGKLLNPAGEYAAKFAENHGMSIVEAMEQPMVKARFCYFADTGM